MFQPEVYFSQSAMGQILANQDQVVYSGQSQDRGSGKGDGSVVVNVIDFVVGLAMHVHEYGGGEGAIDTSQRETCV